MSLGYRNLEVGGFAGSWNDGPFVVYVDGAPFACCTDRSEGLGLMYGQLNAATSARVHLVRV
jgi:hypothetical protein